MTRAALEKYFQELLQSYYAKNREKPGLWGGQGAVYLGLTGPVESKSFGTLLDGLSPNGRQKLVQNAQHPKRQSGWDMTFSAPKSVSVLWATSPEAIGKIVETCQWRAVEKALRYAEEHAGITRRGQGGKIKERAMLVFASFEHYSSRANDPQLHTHNVLLNLCVRADGTTGTLQSRDIFRLKIALGEFYRKELAAELCAQLGLTIEFDKVGFRIVGVPQSVCRHFSKRRRAVEKRLDEHGEHGARAAKRVALETRPHKKDIPRATLLPAWQKEAAELGWTQAQALELIPPDKRRALAEGHLAGNSGIEKRNEAQTKQASRRSKPQRDSDLTGFENYPDFVGPVAPQETKTVRRTSEANPPNSPPQQSTSSNLRAESEAQTAKEGDSTRRASGRNTSPPKPQRDSGLTGFENYPDFVGPIGSEAARLKRKSSPANGPRSGRFARNENVEASQHGTERNPQESANAAPAGEAPFDPASRHRRQSGQSQQAAGQPAGPQASRAWERGPRSSARRWWSKLPRPYVGVAWRRAFPNAPSWSAASKWKVPVVVLSESESSLPRNPKWGRINWRQNTLIGELRIQRRRLFPNAPHWNPARKLSLPALRWVSPAAAARIKTLRQSH